MFCLQCGNEIKEGAKFCGKCGWAVPVAAVQGVEKRCASCGTVLKDGVKFCPKCGTKVGIGSLEQQGYTSGTGTVSPTPSAASYNENGDDAYYVMHVDGYNERDYDKAIAGYTEAIRLDQNDKKAYLGRAGAYFGRAIVLGSRLVFKGDCKGDIDKAIADYTKVIQLDPNDKKAYFCRGRTYSSRSYLAKTHTIKGDCKGDIDKAIADYTEAIRLDPNYKEAYLDRGATSYANNDYDKVIADYTEAIRLDPNYTEAYICRARVYYDNKGDFRQARADVNKALQFYHNYPNKKIFDANLKGLERLLKEKGY